MAVLDDEIRTLKLFHRSLMKLRPEARRRVCRYIHERHVCATEPEERQAANPNGCGAIPNEAQSIELARKHVIGAAGVELASPPPGVTVATGACRPGMSRAEMMADAQDARA